MKSWSRYNTLFRSEKYGGFLYNALTGVMLELNKYYYQLTEEIQKSNKGLQNDNDLEFISLLEQKGFLVEREEEVLRLMEIRLHRNIASYNTTYLGLTICPTLECNFGCPYCFEPNLEDAKAMSNDTLESLIKFIRHHEEAKYLSVSWYGGEPLLAFDVIKKLTGRFLELYPDYDNAVLVTNGYLLDKTKINQLNELKITSMQITIDGSGSTHNKRRRLKNGKATYGKILSNIDSLFASDWNGNLVVRVNVDRLNMNEYYLFQLKLIERYKGKKITIYPGHLSTYYNHSYDESYGLSNDEWASFIVHNYNKGGVVPWGGFYPVSGNQNTCIATNQYGYVIGSKGEIYKCWEDVGKEYMIIGSIHDKSIAINKELFIRYSIEADPFNDIDCIECPVMPICGGGCANKRLRSQHLKEVGIEYCSALKDSLQTYLEAYLDTWWAKEICAIMIGKTTGTTMDKGYRMVQPEGSSRNRAVNPLKCFFKH